MICHCCTEQEDTGRGKVKAGEIVMAKTAKYSFSSPEVRKTTWIKVITRRGRK